MTSSILRRVIVTAGFVVATLATGASALAQGETPDKTRMDIYGFAMLDMGYQAGTSDPLWFDVMRPTKLPSDPDEFGGDGRTYAGVRQSRLGFKTWTPTSKGELTTIFEFELFGVGDDAGQTTFRLRHAYGQFGKWGAGQTWSPFMDPDVFPNSIEYWGPSGMVFFRNVQIRYMPLMGENEVTIALERPGASGDTGVLVGEPDIDFATVTARFPAPDLTGHYRMNKEWGHLQIGGIFRKMEWDDSAGLLSGHATGWGVNVSSNIKINKDILKLQVVVGEGIANYMNDATFDVGAVTGPEIGEALPLVGIVAFYDRTWNDRFTSTFGYSSIDLDNSNAQLADAFNRGDYALANLLYYPVKNLMWGGEVQWGRRENFSDGFTEDDLRIQFSVRYNFSKTLGGNS